MSFKQQTIARTVLREMALQREEFAKRLREARIVRGWSQEDAAHHIGVTTRAYARWELAQSYPHVTRMDEIADALGVDREYLQGPPPAPLGLGRDDPALGRLEAIEQRLGQTNAMLLALLAHHGITVDRLVTDAVESVVDDRQSRTGQSRRRRKTGGAGQ